MATDSDAADLGAQESINTEMFRCGHYLCFCYEIYTRRLSVYVLYSVWPLGRFGLRPSIRHRLKYLYDICEEE